MIHSGVFITPFFILFLYLPPSLNPLYLSHLLQVYKARQSVYHRKTDWLLVQYNTNHTCGFNWHQSFKLLDEHSFLRNVIIIMGRYQPPWFYHWSKHNDQHRIMHAFITNHIIALTSLNCCHSDSQSLICRCHRSENEMLCSESSLLQTFLWLLLNSNFFCELQK